MKTTLALLLTVGGIMSASASITLNTAFGVAFDKAGLAVPDGTLWALIVDSNNDSVFPGGFGLNASLGEAGANTTFTTGQSLAVGGIIGGDTIFAMGGFNGTAIAATAGLSLSDPGGDLGVNGLAAGRAFAFYWFPGVLAAQGRVGTEVGGVHSNVDAAVLGDMVIPSDGSIVTTGAGNADLGGTLPNSRMQAVALVPEASTALLGALGALGLLRRRR